MSVTYAGLIRAEPLDGLLRGELVLGEMPFVQVNSSYRGSEVWRGLIDESFFNKNSDPIMTTLYISGVEAPFSLEMKTQKRLHSKTEDYIEAFDLYPGTLDEIASNLPDRMFHDIMRAKIFFASSYELRQLHINYP